MKDEREGFFIDIDMSKKQVKVGPIVFDLTKMTKNQQKVRRKVYIDEVFELEPDTPFEQLHQILQKFAKIYKFDYETLVRMMGVTPVIRKITMQNCGIPPYVCQRICQLMVKFGAAIPYLSGYKKDAEYTRFLARDSGVIFDTSASIHYADQNRLTYILPDEETLEHMSVQDLSAEIEQCAELKSGKKWKAKVAILTKYREKAMAKRMKNRHSQGTEADRMKQLAAQHDSGEDEAEYDDMAEQHEVDEQ